MQRLFYETKVGQGMKQAAEVYSKKMNFEIKNEYADFHNDTCPCCSEKMKVSHDNTVKNVGAFSLGIYPDFKIVVPYVICKPCSKITNKDKDAGNRIEKNVFKALGLE